MIVFDLEHSGATERVAVIGSCRVRTPLLTLKQLGRLDLLISQPALTHTFAEARQNYRHALGEARVPDAFAPYIFQKEASPAASRYPREILDGVQTVIVEMCDTRQIRKGEWVFQNNYFAREFVQKRAAELLEWYRAFSKGKEITPEIVESALAKLGASGHPVDEVVEDIVRNTRLTSPDRDQIIADAKAVAFDPSKRWIFLSHFAIPGDTGTIMNDRRKLGESVEAAAKAVGAEFFDPSRLIEHYGRRVALRGDGTDIYEYDWDFIPVMGEIILNIVRQGVGKKLKLPPAPVKSEAAEGKKTDPESEVDAAPAAKVAPAAKTATVAKSETASKPPRAEKAAAPATEEASELKLADAAKKLNKTMVTLHRDRLDRLGSEKSGLFDQYVSMLNDGQLVRPRDVEVARVIIEELPSFERYVMLKAGLGSVPLLLALMGRNVTAFEARAERVDAIKAATDAVSVSKKKVADRLDVKVGAAAEAVDQGATLCIAVGYISKTAEAEQARVMSQLARYDALLVEPRTFLRHRSTVDQAQVGGELAGIGFQHVSEVATGIILATKSKVQSAAA